MALTSLTRGLPLPMAHDLHFSSALGPQARLSAPESCFVGKQQKCLFEPLSTLIAGMFVGSKSQPTSSCAGEVITSFVLMYAW